MGIAFPATISGGRNTHQAGVEAILHIAFQDAIFDQDIFLCRRAFVIDAQRSAALVNRTIINNRHAGRGNTLTNPPGKGAGALADKVAFQAMTDSFVQYDAGPAGAQKHRLFARGRINAFPTS